MNPKKYVMVTHWDKHWDALPNHETYFPKDRILFELVNDNLVDNAPTLFIKLKNKRTKKPERTWIGYVYEFKEQADKVYFKVNLEKEVPLPEISEKKYLVLKEGWYLIDCCSKEGSIQLEFSLYPPLFYSLLKTREGGEFEDYVFMLLKLVGIHNIYKFENREQRGKPDGFFVFGKHLAVIYDCTLKEDFAESKAQQIENYCSQLKGGKLRYKTRAGEKEYDISARDKQVWIITRGNTRLVKQVDDIKIKEVSIQRLIEIYKKRLKENLDEGELEKELINI